jgi:hypothetical protein
MQITLDKIPLIKLARKFSKHELTLKECKELVETVDELWKKETTNQRLSAAYTANHETILMIYALATGDLDLIKWMLTSDFGCMSYTRGAWWALNGALETGKLRMEIDELNDVVKQMGELTWDLTSDNINKEIEISELKQTLDPGDTFGDYSPCGNPDCPWCHPEVAANYFADLED